MSFMVNSVCNFIKRDWAKVTVDTVLQSLGSVGGEWAETIDTSGIFYGDGKEYVGDLDFHKTTIKATGIH